MNGYPRRRMAAPRLQLLASASLALTLAACGGGDEGDAEDDVFVVTTDYQVVFSPTLVVAATPAPITVTATGNFSTAAGEEITARGSVEISGAAATAVTVNVGFPGENGPVAATLTDDGGGRWSLPATTELDLAELRLAETAGFYVAVATPQGSLRGQIVPPEWAVAGFELSPNNSVPSATSSGSAAAGIALNPRTGLLRARVSLAGVSDVTGANIRQGIAGSRGDIAMALEQSAADSSVWGTIDIGNPDAGNSLTTTGLDLLGAGALYFAVETVRFPDGELRGQIADSTNQSVAIALTNDQVVTSGPQPATGASGTATVTWVEALRRFGVAVNTDIANATSVGVYAGAAGEAGTLVFSLMPDTALPGNWVLTPRDLTEAQAADLESDGWYVSIETAAFGDGELRGQIIPEPQ